MEINFQKQHQTEPISTNKVTKSKGRKRSKGSNNFVGVRQRTSGKWVAEIKDTTKKIRMWLGTYEAAEEAARAYDQAAVLLRGPNTRTNFLTTRVSQDSPLASRIKNLINSKKIAKQKSLEYLADSTSSSTTMTTSPISSCDDILSSEYAQRNNLDETILSIDQESQLFDDSNTYKPDLDIVTSSSSSCFSSELVSWDFEQGFEFAQELLDIPTKTEMGFSEFEVMKVERQISASLYAVNGVQDYMEIIRDPYESLWDYPLSCTL
ncbi:hypothetical protein RND71_036100 [Anisodus tanguticus]|uniref:AP2/ERF domain-containing protein n=1 Tax=Anisodus tanguticus TaxID=243964 RepID=A0AAE1V231_9SOLA|nr:hypothetical protein RND71_036100 [Anisodus tanguticus]